MTRPSFLCDRKVIVLFVWQRARVCFSALPRMPGEQMNAAAHVKDVDEIDARLRVVKRIRDSIGQAYASLVHSSDQGVPLPPLTATVDVPLESHYCIPSCNFRALGNDLFLCEDSGLLHACGQHCAHAQESEDRSGVACTVTAQIIDGCKIEASDAYEEMDRASAVEHERAMSYKTSVTNLKRKSNEAIDSACRTIIGSELMPRDVAGSDLKAEMYRSLLLETLPVESGSFSDDLRRQMHDLQRASDERNRAAAGEIEEVVKEAKKIAKAVKVTATASPQKRRRTNSGDALRVYGRDSEVASLAVKALLHKQHSEVPKARSSGPATGRVATERAMRNELVIKSGSGSASASSAAASGKSQQQHQLSVPGRLEAVTKKLLGQVFPGVSVDAKEMARICGKSIELWELLHSAGSIKKDIKFEHVCVFLFFYFLKGTHPNAERFTFRCAPSPYLVGHKHTIVTAAAILKTSQSVFTETRARFDHMLLELAEA